MWYVEEIDENGNILETEGPFLVTFDKETVYNVWTDYPDKMKPEEVQIFQKECPFWADFFSDRLT